MDRLPEPTPTEGRLDARVATRTDLANGLRDVPPKQRAVLVLRSFEGPNVAAVATALRCSDGNVKSQTARGLAKLRTVLGAEVETHG